MKTIKNYAKDTLANLSTVDGVVFVGVGVAALLLKDLVPFIAAVAIVYGGYKIFIDKK